MISMNAKSKNFRRILLTGLGLQTIAASGMGIYGGITQYRAWHGDPLASASLVALLLGILLAFGGGWLVLRGLKYQGENA